MSIVNYQTFWPRLGPSSVDEGPSPCHHLKLSSMALLFNRFRATNISVLQSVTLSLQDNTLTLLAEPPRGLDSSANCLGSYLGKLFAPCTTHTSSLTSPMWMHSGACAHKCKVEVWNISRTMSPASSCIDAWAHLTCGRNSTGPYWLPEGSWVKLWLCTPLVFRITLWSISLYGMIWYGSHILPVEALSHYATSQGTQNSTDTSRRKEKKNMH